MAILRVGIERRRNETMVEFSSELTRIVREMARCLPHPTDGAALLVAASGCCTEEMTVEWPIDAGVDGTQVDAPLRSVSDGRMTYLEISLDIAGSSRVLHPVAKLDFRLLELRMLTRGDPRHPPPHAAIRELVVSLIPPPHDVDTWSLIGRILRHLSERYIDIFIAYTQRLGGSPRDVLDNCTSEWRKAAACKSRGGQHSWLELKDMVSRVTVDDVRAYIAWCRRYGYLP